MYIEFCVSLGCSYYYGFSPGFDFDFLGTSQEVGWREHL